MNLRVKPSSPLNVLLPLEGSTYLFLTHCAPIPPGFAVHLKYVFIAESVVLNLDAR